MRLRCLRYQSGHAVSNEVKAIGALLHNHHVARCLVNAQAVKPITLPYVCMTPICTVCFELAIVEDALPVEMHALAPDTRSLATSGRALHGTAYSVALFLYLAHSFLSICAADAVKARTRTQCQCLTIAIQATAAYG